MPTSRRQAKKPDSYGLRLSQIASVIIPEDVVARKGNKTAWPVLQGISIAQVEIPPSKWRAPHYHTNAFELAVIIQGTARAGLVTPQNQLILIDLEDGDCVHFPMGWPHWLRNTSRVPVKAYFNYNNELPVTIEIPNIVGHFTAAEKGLSLEPRVRFKDTE